MDYEDGLDDEPVPPFLPPDDRLWRHPSEVAATAAGTAAAAQRRTPPGALTVAILTGTVAALITTGVLAATFGIGRRADAPDVRRSTAAGTQPIQPISTTPLDVVGVAERVRPSLVKVAAETNEGEAAASGVVFSADGLVVTSQHVVDGADAISVTLADGRSMAASVVGADVDTDVALVRVDADDLVPARFGTTGSLKVGQPAIAIGMPVGNDARPAVAVGVVSALGQEITTNGRPPLLDMIQTDAPMPPSSSGGALVDAHGTVIGLTTSIAEESTSGKGMGLAVPVDVVRHVGEELAANGQVHHAWLGVRGENVGMARARELGISGGARVIEAVPGAPAARLGLVPGDVIVALDGRPVQSMSALVVALRFRKVGESVIVRVVREGRAVEMTATLAERPDDL